MEWEARWSGGMREAAVLITTNSVVPQSEFARHIRHISGGSELYRADPNPEETVLFLYQSGSGRTQTARELASSRTWDSWDAAELDFQLPEGSLKQAFLGQKVILQDPTRWLLNSAVIPAGGYGTYEYRPATWEELREFMAQGYQSRVGYQETADLISLSTGLPAPTINRELSELQPGDIAMVVRLRYRVGPTKKGATVSQSMEDWEVGRLIRVT